MTEETTMAETVEETIGEVGEDAEAPAELELADKVEAEPTDEPTFETEDVKAENFLGTFKTKEDADKGFKDAQSKITAQGNRIKELEAEIKSNSFTETAVTQRVAKYTSQLNREYESAVRQLSARHAAELSQLKSQTADPQLIAQIEAQATARFFAQIASLANAFDSKHKNGKLAIEQEAQQAEAVARAKDAARYSNGKTGEMIVSAWYDSPQSIDEVAELFSAYKTLVIEDYLKEQAALSEDSAHKGKLATNAASAHKPKYGNNHIFTLKELASMSDAEFAKYESIIDDQIARRLVK